MDTFNPLVQQRFFLFFAGYLRLAMYIPMTKRVTGMRQVRNFQTSAGSLWTDRGMDESLWGRRGNVWDDELQGVYVVYGCLW